MTRGEICDGEARGRYSVRRGTADLAHNRDYADGYHDFEIPLAGQEGIT